MALVVVWLLPFFVLVSGYISNKTNAFKKVRNKLYILILFCAFLLDLTSLSFVNGYVDTIRYLIVTFVMCDIGFNILRIKKVVFKTIMMLLGVTAFLYAYSGWILDGPSRVMEHCLEKQLDTYVNNTHNTYFVRQHVNYLLKNKTLSLYEVKKVPFLEKRLSSFKVPEGYISSEFTFGWSNTAKGVRMNLISGKDTLWTLGKGF
jgi:hypothetical protein